MKRNTPAIHFLLIILSILSTGCENDINLLDDYREIPIIYGVLDINDKTNNNTHYLRLQKAFLGNGNALAMAQVSDSIYYDTSTIRIYLDRQYNGVPNLATTRQWTPFSYVKSEGVFSNQGHIIYKLENYYTSLTSTVPYDTTYRLRMKNLVSGLEVVAETPLIRTLQVLNPNPATPTSTINLVDIEPFRCRFKTPKNGKVYTLKLRINYEISESGVIGSGVPYFIDLNLDHISSLGTQGGEDLSFILDPIQIFQFIGSKINKPDPPYQILASSFTLDFLLSAGTLDYYNYMQVNLPENTLISAPDFTNISQGRGIFACRFHTSVTDKALSPSTISALEQSVFTRQIFN